MSVIKTFLALLALLLPVPARSGPSGAPDLMMVFAACTGRLSAMMEHQWIVDPPASDLTRVQRAKMIELLEAAMRPDAGRAVLSRRIEAKMAQAGLLTRARQDAHPRLAEHARRRADTELGACLSLLLS